MRGWTEVILPCHVSLGGIWNALLGTPAPWGMASYNAIDLVLLKMIMSWSVCMQPYECYYIYTPIRI